MKNYMFAKHAMGLKYFARGFCILFFSCCFTSVQAGFLDEMVNDAKASLSEAADSSKESIRKGVNDVTEDIRNNIKTTIDETVESTVVLLDVNRNRITKLKVEGIVVGDKVDAAEGTLTKAGYKKLSSNPWLFQRDSNILKFSSKNGMINSIELDGAATAGDAFIDQEKSRIETSLGKTCPPTQTRGTWLCNLEGDSNEYYLELKVRRNKYSYLVEGNI